MNFHPGFYYLSTVVFVINREDLALVAAVLDCSVDNEGEQETEPWMKSATTSGPSAPR